jgi:hypothetical protein
MYPTQGTPSANPTVQPVPTQYPTPIPSAFPTILEPTFNPTVTPTAAPTSTAKPTTTSPPSVAPTTAGGGTNGAKPGVPTFAPSAAAAALNANNGGANVTKITLGDDMAIVFGVLGFVCCCLAGFYLYKRRQDEKENKDNLSPFEKWMVNQESKTTTNIAGVAPSPRGSRNDEDDMSIGDIYGGGEDDYDYYGAAGAQDGRSTHNPVNDQQETNERFSFSNPAARNNSRGSRGSSPGPGPRRPSQSGNGMNGSTHNPMSNGGGLHEPADGYDQYPEDYQQNDNDYDDYYGGNGGEQSSHSNPMGVNTPPPAPHRERNPLSSARRASRAGVRNSALRRSMNNGNQGN